MPRALASLSSATACSRRPKPAAMWARARICCASDLWAPQRAVALLAPGCCRSCPAWAVSASSTAIRPLASNLRQRVGIAPDNPLERLPLLRRAGRAADSPRRCSARAPIGVRQAARAAPECSRQPPSRPPRARAPRARRRSSVGARRPSPTEPRAVLRKRSITSRSRPRAASARPRTTCHCAFAESRQRSVMSSSARYPPTMCQVAAIRHQYRGQTSSGEFHHPRSRSGSIRRRISRAALGWLEYWSADA